MKILPKTNCPLNSFEPCKELECAWFMNVKGKNPNTGEERDEWGCAMTWLPIMTLETAAMSRQTGAAVESFRNEMVKSNQLSLEMLAASSNNKLIGDK